MLNSKVDSNYTSSILAVAELHFQWNAKNFPKYFYVNFHVFSDFDVSDATR